MNMGRVRALAVLGTLVVTAAVLVVYTLSRDEHSPVAAESCPVGYVPADLSLPDDYSTVRLNVYNATKKPNLASEVAAKLRFRKFTVLKTGNSKKAYPDEVAVLRYGPKAVGKAHVLRAYFLDNATPDFDIERDSDVIDVFLGGRYQDLATQTEFNQAVGQLGFPVLPEGTCDQATMTQATPTPSAAPTSAAAESKKPE